MKTNELMVGDWVMYNPNVFIEDEYEPTKECYPTKIENGEDIDLSVEDCYTPIPLTPEILEKNFESKCKRWYWGDEFSDINIDEFTDGLWEVTVWDVEIGMLDCKIYISYVHELQHVLKLCGIDRLEVRV